MSQRRISRRQFVQSTAQFASLATLAPGMLAQSASSVAQGKMSLPAVTARGQRVPKDFIGLSYEVMQLEDPTFFSEANVGLIRSFRELSANGVLRLGGNTSEFSWWKSNADDVAPVRSTGASDPGEPSPNTLYAVTPEAVHRLKGFLDATGWTCIYGLNLGYGTPEIDTAEAIVVHTMLGKRLQYFQIGNEVDIFSRHLRDKATWNVPTYLKNWLSIARAVQKALPDATFGMPDVAADVSWLPQIAELWEAVPNKPNVKTLSHHYYFGGPPANPDVNIDRLLHIDPKVGEYAALAIPAAAKMHVATRMTEGNTCYQGGKPGVSDVFASALWSADYALRLMELGYSGVNLHGGSGRAVAVSVGGLLRGEQLMADATAPHAKPFYTPIANEGTMAGSGTEGKLDGRYRLQPVGYGLKFAGNFTETKIGPVEITQAEVSVVLNVSAYAGRCNDGTTIVAILNKDARRELELATPLCTVTQMLTAASLEAPEAHWEVVGESRRPQKRVRVPAHTALLLRLA